jgi:CRISPR-associated protein Cas1
MWKWDTVILGKTQELACFLLDKSKQMGFMEPCPSLHRSDTQELRNRILELTQKEAKELGIGRSTLHYLRMNAKRQHCFKVYTEVRKKLESRTTVT